MISKQNLLVFCYVLGKSRLAAYGARLESAFGASHRGFESLLFRQFSKFGIQNKSVLKGDHQRLDIRAVSAILN